MNDDDREDDNPLLRDDEHIAYDAIRPEHVAPALDQLLADAEAALERTVSDDVPAEWDAIAAVLEVAVERLGVAWGAVGFLQSVADTPALRAAHAAQQPRVVAFYTQLGADTRLYAKYKRLAANPAAGAGSPERRKALADALRDFVLDGAELQGAARERHAAIQDRSAALSQAFGDHVLDATDAFELIVDEGALEGVPDDVVEAARIGAAAAGRTGCRLTLQAPCLTPVLQFATDRALRERLYRAHATRASEFGPAELDNTPLIDELVALRQEEAALLGLPSYAHLSLVPKMAGSPDEVVAFLRDLARRARPFAEREREALQRFAADELGLDALQPWDRSFAGEKLKQRLHAFSDAEVRRYFPAPRVVQGLFDLADTLFGISIRESTAPVWHDDVRFFTVWRDGQQVAGFYLDLHARPGKASGAWMDEARQRWRRPGGRLQRPLAHLVCDFAPGTAGRPALLTHDDVITLFHEFGHGLHHMLTRVDERAVAGIAGVEWDACELPSQFMENFAWEFEVLQRISAHVDDGTPLPRTLFDRMRAARNFQNGLAMLRHCEMAMFDMRLHLEGGPAAAVAAQVNADIALLPAPPFLRYPQTFTHLFDGGYAAGYYGYAWAEVLSADAYGAFEEAGVFDPAVGRRFREQVLEVGGSRPALESFIAFRGRAPTIDTLLRHQGLAGDPASSPSSPSTASPVCTASSAGSGTAEAAAADAAAAVPPAGPGPRCTADAAAA